MDAITEVPTGLDAIRQETNPSRAQTSRNKLIDDIDTFLKLLTTQLRHQDPTEPLDTNEFTKQIAALSQVEQAISTNENLEQLIALNQKVGVDAGVNYIGQVVEAPGNAGFLVNGVAPFVYELSRNAKDVKVVISDASGSVVFSGQGNGQVGRNLVTWDGFNSFNGRQSPDGEYHIAITATDTEDQPVTATTFTSGVVTAVEQDEGEVKLIVGTQDVPLQDVLAVRAQSFAPPPAQTESTESQASDDTDSTTDEEA